MKRELYYVHYQNAKEIGEVIVAAYTQNNAKAIVMEYFDTDNLHARPCTIADAYNVKDKRIMHMSHIMTPLDLDTLKMYGIK